MQIFSTLFYIVFENIFYTYKITADLFGKNFYLIFAEKRNDMEEEVQQIPQQQQAPKPPKIDAPKVVLAFASDWLARRAGSLNAAAEKMGVTRQALVYHLNGDKYVTYKMAEKIDSTFGIRSQYLMTGTHPVFKPDAGAVENGDLFYQAEDLKDSLDLSEERVKGLTEALEKANSELAWLREKVALLEELLRIYRAGAKQ